MNPNNIPGITRQLGMINSSISIKDIDISKEINIQLENK